MKKIFSILFIVLVLILLPLTLFANDVIYISDGSKVEGEIINADESVITIVIANSSQLDIKYDVITKIVFMLDNSSDEGLESRTELKDKIIEIIKDKPDIIMKIEKKIRLKNVNPADYDMENITHKVNGIYLKKYYKKNKIIRYMDKVSFSDTEIVIGQVIDIDKNKVRIKTDEGVLKTYYHEDIYAILLQNNTTDPIPNHRKLILNMMRYYSKNYWDWRREKKNAQIEYFAPSAYQERMTSVSFSLGYSPNYFTAYEGSNAVYAEFLYSWGHLYSQGAYQSVGAYLGVYFDVPYYDGTPIIAFLLESNASYTVKGGIFRPLFSLALGFYIADNYHDSSYWLIPETSNFWFIWAGGVGFELMFTKNIGIRTLINYKSTGFIRGVGIEIGILFRFDTGVDSSFLRLEKAVN